MIANLLLLTGADDFRLRERAKFYRTAFQQKYPDGEIEIFDADASFHNLQGAVMTPNLFGGKKMAVCQEFWTAEKFEEAQKAKFFEKLPDFADLCTVLALEPTLDKRMKFSKFLLEQAKVENFDPLDESGLLRWIETYVQKIGGKISRICAQKLLTRCGSDLWNLSREIEKLVTAAEGQEISSELIESLTLRHPSLEIWDFLGDLSRRDLHGALNRFRTLIEKGESVHQIFSMIQREIRIHALILSGIEQNFDSRMMASETGLHPFVLQKTVPLSRAFSLAQITQMYDQLFLIERRLKTGEIFTSANDTSEFELAIEKFIISVCKK